MSVHPQIDPLVRKLPGVAIALPGSADYRRSTAPENTSVVQNPMAVALPDTAAGTAKAVAAAAELGASVAVQSTGHGAGRGIGADTVLIDTGGLRHIDIDPAARVARVGAGVTWGEVQQAAEPHGLLGLSGTASGVGVAGYTFGGGVGWLARPHGLAAGSLISVEYVDGTGGVRRARDDAPDAADRDAIWAFRGGAPVGLATELEFRLVAVRSLWAGLMLWPAENADALLNAWTTAAPAIPDTVTSTVAMLQLPPDGPFPDELLGRAVVHLSYASVDGEAPLTELRSAMRAVAPPAVDDGGAADAARLARVHLDPPVPLPARGTGLWLTDDLHGRLPELFNSARIGSPNGLGMVEVRHVASAAVGGPGARTVAPSPYLLHAVGIGDFQHRAATSDALKRVERAAGIVDTALDAPSFREGDPLAGRSDRSVAARLRTISEQVDPHDTFRFERVPA